MQVIVDRNVCIGAAACVIVAGKTFQLDLENKAEVINGCQKMQTPDESSARTTEGNDLRQTIIEAAQACPVRAIRLLEDDGTPIY